MSRNGARLTSEFCLRVPDIRTERLLVRPHRVVDAERWHEIQSSPTVREFTTWPQLTRRAALRQLKARTRQTQLTRVNDVLALAIENEGELVGELTLQLRSLTTATRCLEISWVVHPAHQGLGIAYEALLPLLAEVRANVETLLLVAVVHPENAASVALAHKLGLQPLAGTVDRTVFVGRNRTH